MKTITINVSDPIYRDVVLFAKKMDSPTSELIRGAMEAFHAKRIARITSLRNRRPVSVGATVQPLTSEDDLLDEMIHDSRD